MNSFVYKVIIYLLSFILSIYGLSCMDFSKLLKKNKVREFYVLYFVLACALAYLFGTFLMNIMYTCN